MYDLQYLWGEKNSEFVDFMGRSKMEKEAVNEQYFCNMEVPLRDTNLPSYSDIPLDTVKLTNLKENLSITDQLVKEIEEKINSNLDIGHSFEVEYFYIDFRMYILGRKIKAYQ